MYKTLNMSKVYEELSAITMIDLEAEAKFIETKDPLKRMLVGDEIYGDVGVHEIV